MDRIAARWVGTPRHARRLTVLATNLLLLNVAVWLVARFVWLDDLEPEHLWAGQMDLTQVLLLFDTLVLLWREGTLALQKFVGEQVTDLKRNKAVVLTDRDAHGDRITNIGDVAAVNVWYLTSEGQPPVSLGALRAGDSRPLSDPLADRHLLIAEARPNFGRQFTPTLNARTSSGEIAHGFVKLTSGLTHQGTIASFLKLEPNLLGELRNWVPGQ